MYFSWRHRFSSALCFLGRKKRKKWCFFFSCGRTNLLPMKAQICFCEAHLWFFGKEKIVSIFAHIFVLPREAKNCISLRHMSVLLEKRKNEKNIVLFAPDFFWKKVRRNLLTSYLVLNISTRGIPRWKWFRIWTHGLRDKTFWINGSTKKGKLTGCDKWRTCSAPLVATWEFSLFS